MRPSSDATVAVGQAPRVVAWVVVGRDLQLPLVAVALGAVAADEAEVAAAGARLG